MPANPVKRGIKVWCRADAYMSEIQVYIGKSDGVEGGLGKRVVWDLAHKQVSSSCIVFGIFLANCFFHVGPHEKHLVRTTISTVVKPNILFHYRGDSQIVQMDGMTALLWSHNSAFHKCTATATIYSRSDV